MANAIVIRENDEYDLADLFSHAQIVGEYSQLQLEIGQKSRRIKGELGLRQAPIVLNESDGQRTIRVSGVAGLLRLGNTNFQVAPKFVNNAKTDAWQTAVLSILDRVRKRHFAISRVRDINLTHVHFIDHVALAFTDALEIALRGESVREYRTHVETANYLRGRLDINRQLQSIASRPDQMYCEVDYLSGDNQFNRLLHWAGQRFLSLVFDQRLKQKLTKTASMLPQVSLPILLPTRLPSRPPPQYGHYSEALEIAATLAKGQGHGQATGRFAGYGYLLNMERLYESFIEVSLRKVTSCLENETYRIASQVSGIFAEPMDANGKAYFTRPDNILYRGNTPRLIIDAKYKMLADADSGSTSKPLNSDVYQLFASMVSNGCPNGLLIYPRLSADRMLDDGKLRSWKIIPPALVGRVSAVAVNFDGLCSKADFDHFDSDLCEHVANALNVRP